MNGNGNGNQHFRSCYWNGNRSYEKNCRRQPATQILRNANESQRQFASKITNFLTPLASKNRVFLNDELQTAVTKFLLVNANVADGAALIRSTKTLKHFTPNTLCALFKSIYRKSGISTSSHSGRRTFATVKNANGVGMATIQKLMGHKNIQTTALYCDVSDEQLANAANVF